MAKLILFVPLMFMLMVGFGYAEDEKDKTIYQRLKALEEQERNATKSSGSHMDIETTGFVDVSLLYDDNAQASTFSMDEVEIDIFKQLSKGLSLRTDLNFRNMDSGGGLDADEIVEQGFVTLAIPSVRGLELTFGKFNAPIGFELLDPPDMYQYSHALVFNLGLPTNVTGIMLTAKPSAAVDVNLYLVNGWDLINDNNKDKTVGARIGFTLSDKVGLGLSAIYGPERAGENADKRFILDLDGTLNITDSTVIGLEVNYGGEEMLPGSKPLPNEDVKWFGYLVMIHQDFTPRFGATLRYDFFDDKDAARTGEVQQLQAVAVALTVSLDEGAGFLIEYRHDWSDMDTFTLPNGTMTDSNDSLALEFTYSF